MKEKNIESLRQQFSDSPAQLAWVEANLTDPERVQALLERVDESPYGVSQWIDAFVVVWQWLDPRGLQAAFQDQLGYVDCACEAAGAGANLTLLPDLVREMLDSYGFECAQPKDR